LRRIRSKLSFANVVSVIALIAALGLGTAWAVQRNSIRSVHIVNGQVKGVDVRNNGLTGKDLREASLSAVPDADAVGGIPPSQIGAVGRTNWEPGLCTDDDHNGTDCTSVDLDLPRSGRVLVIATADYFASPFDDASGTGSDSDDPTLVHGFCRIALDGIPIAATTIGEVKTVPDQEALALNRVTAPLDPGTHTFALRCVETDGGMLWSDSSISAVMLGSG